ncbi:MAG TPA: hypothetical protein VGV85_12110, partial [Longimicrobiaceae bacterium]|nr:hypothetical protein [Longimicrobiaceae bacterium]
MLIQEVETHLSPAEVIEQARSFFSMQFSPYAGFEEDSSDSHIRLAPEAGDVTIGVGTRDGKTVVRGSSSRLHHEVSQFFVTLAPPEEVRQNVPGPGVSGAG